MVNTIKTNLIPGKEKTTADADYNEIRRTVDQRQDPLVFYTIRNQPNVVMRIDRLSHIYIVTYNVVNPVGYPILSTILA